MPHWKSTDIKHFVQWLTPNESDGDGSLGGHIVSPDGSDLPLYNMKQENPPVAYHIEADDVSIADWLVMKDGTITDHRDRPITSEDTNYILHAAEMGMLEIIA